MLSLLFDCNFENLDIEVRTYVGILCNLVEKENRELPPTITLHAWLTLTYMVTSMTMKFNSNEGHTMYLSDFSKK